MTESKIDIKSLSPEALLVFLAGMGKEKFRAGQILRWVYKRGVCSFSEMTDLAKDFRSELEKRAFISDWEPEYVETRRDGTEKYLFRLADGESVETVRIPMKNDRSPGGAPLTHGQATRLMLARPVHDLCLNPGRLCHAV